MAMTRTAGRATAWVLGATCLAVLTGSAPAGGEAVQDVNVLNFPSPQRIEGAVDLRHPVALASSFLRRTATVLPARLAQVRELTDGGELRAEGFTRAIVSLAGVATSRIVAPGAVGVLLVPNDPDILASWQESGVAQLSWRLEAPVAPSEQGLFEAAPVEFRPAFPSYRIFFYDTLQASVEVRLHAYMTSS
jgi:hypothetical protein